MSVLPPTGLEGPAVPAQPERPQAAVAPVGASAAATPTPTREAALTLLLRQGEATAAELADHLGVSVQAMRRHLRSLEEDGLVEACASQEGPGRPSNRWHLTSQGHDHFPDGSEHFALGLLQSIRDSLPPGSLRLLLDRQAREKADLYRNRIGGGTLHERLERLVELRRHEGYVAELQRDAGLDAQPAGGGAPESWILSEFHCSVMRIAEEFPLICDQELQLIRRTFPDCQVERVHWRLQEGHSCGFRLTPLPGQS
ncbi:MAG: iron-sulfur cluster biosynthesis transcriptional regulator SufR [Synechococcus sp.]|nr:iron-sulfur cluster biosynthesis transcriptional regulator SufR [Synechococcus sp.]